MGLLKQIQGEDKSLTDTWWCGTKDARFEFLESNQGNLPSFFWHVRREAGFFLGGLGEN